MNSENDCINCWAAKVCGACFATAVKNNRFDIVRKRERCEVLRMAKHIDFIKNSPVVGQCLCPYRPTKTC